MVLNKSKSPNIMDSYILALDYGEAHIGIALGRNGLVAPIKTINAKNIQAAITEINKVALQNKVVQFVVGLPLDAHGKETKKSLAVRKFVKMLKIYSKKPVVYQDEHSTTVDSATEMFDWDISRKKRRTNDHFAATLILKRYYDSLEH